MRKNSTRRIIAILLSVMLAAAAFTSCAPQNGGPGGSDSPDATDGGKDMSKITVEPSDDVKVGIWYSVWYKYDPEEPDNKEKNLWLDWDIKYKPLLPDGTYGLYDSMDEELIYFHLQEMTDAGIDFIIMDQTNFIDTSGGFINVRALKVAECIQKWNDEGHKEIRYCSAIGGIQWTQDGKNIEDEAVLLNNRYLRQDFGKSYFMLDGKPLLIVYGDNGEKMWKDYLDGGGKTKYTDKFTLRWADNQSRPGYYGWAYDKGTKQDSEVMVVMPGWDNRKGAEPVPRNHGEWYKESWRQVFAAETTPQMVVINSFNEYAENTGVFTAQTKLYGDDAPDLYWNMTKEYIKLLREGGTFE